MSDIYTLLKEYEVVRRERVIARSVRPGDEFKPFASRLRALKEYGWTLRDSMDFFYKNYLRACQRAKGLITIRSRKALGVEESGAFH